MSKLSELKNHIHSLKEIKNIISAMKNLSLIELSKLNKYILPQNNVVTTIQEAISDFIAFNAYDLSFLQEQPVKAYILIGSERGFCGNFNEMIIDYFEEIPKAEKANQPFLLCVGRKLAIKMSDMSYVFEAIDGPNAVEEIQSSILNLVGFLEEIDQKTKGEIQPNNWAVVYNEESQDIKQTKIICPFSEFKTPKAKSFSFPPLLNIESNLFISEALDQYLFAILHQIFYKSHLVFAHPSCFV